VDILLYVVLVIGERGLYVLRIWESGEGERDEGERDEGRKG